MARVLFAPPSLITSSIARLHPRYTHKAPLLHRLVKINASSSGRRRLTVAPAMQSSDGGGGGDAASKGTNPGATPDQVPGSGWPLPNIPGWAQLVLGAVVLIAIPFYRRILRIEGTIEKGAETAAEIVEGAAEVAEKVAKEVADMLPAGPLKDKVEEIEKIANIVEKDAEVAEVIIEKIDKITDKVEEIVESRVEEGEQIEKTIEKDEETKISSKADQPEADGN